MNKRKNALYVEHQHIFNITMTEIWFFMHAQYADDMNWVFQ